MIVLDLSILNQKGTPMFNSDIFANRPNFGIVGRIFISTDTAAIYRDTGSAWDLIADGTGSASNIYNTDGTLTGNRDVSSGGFTLLFRPQTTFLSSLTASTGASSYSVLGQNNLSYASGFSSSNIGNVYSANGAINLQTFSGSATFAQANLASAMVSVNSIDFTNSSGIVVTMTQSSGIRAMTGHQSQIQFQGSHDGTISHAAISQNLGFYKPASSPKTLTITNAYSMLLNALDDYGAGFTFTNRWGIYQAGASDKNYFAGNLLLGSTLDNGNRLQINGVANALGFIVGNGQYFKATRTSGSLVIDLLGIESGSDNTRLQITDQFNIKNGGGTTLFNMLVTGESTYNFDLSVKGVFRETITTNTQTASYSLALTDNGKLVLMNVATANNLTIPLNSSIAFPVGTKIDVSAIGAGQTTIVATSGVTINSAGGALKLRVQYSGATLIQTATNVWSLFGDITT